MKNVMNLIELNKIEKGRVKAGVVWDQKCGCACAYEFTGGSTPFVNFGANQTDGLHSPPDVCVQ